MARVLSDLLGIARSLLQDTRTGASQRHSDDKLLGYLNLALADARRLRPDLFTPDVSASLPYYTSANVGDAFPVDESYMPAFIEYIAGMVSMEEDEYVAEGRAAALTVRFTQRLVGKSV
jgi:hypothetical protein